MLVREALERAKEALLANLCTCEGQPAKYYCGLHAQQKEVDGWTNGHYKRGMVLARRVLGIEPREMAEDCGATAINLLCGEGGALELLEKMAEEVGSGDRSCLYCSRADAGVYHGPDEPGCPLVAFLRRVPEELGGGGS